MLKRERGAESNRKLPHIFIPSKIATLVPEFVVKDLLWAEHIDDGDQIYIARIRNFRCCTRTFFFFF